jgi:hypothetical protein
MLPDYCCNLRGDMAVSAAGLENLTLQNAFEGF